MTITAVEEIAVFEEWAGQVPDAHRTILPPLPGDRFAAAVSLITASGDKPSLLYERDNALHAALGAAAEVRLSAVCLTLEARGRTWTAPLPAVRPLTSLAEAVRALSSVLGGGQARRLYGWALFELAHLLHETADGAPPEGCLLHLFLPETEVILTQDETVITATGPQRAEIVEHLLRASASPSSGDYAMPHVARPVGHDTTGYRAAVAEVLEDIAAGRLDKAVLSRTVGLDSAPSVDLPATYLAARAANTPARSFLLDLGGWRAAGLSPETILEADGDGRITTQPLAGTRALSRDAARNEALRADLIADPKEVHEHAISVRLACAELGRVCEPGSVVVEEFMAVRERGSVQHLASRVAGRLSAQAGPWDALAALFPAITVTGVPKREALAALREHEDGPRGLYAGAVIAADTAGRLDAALVLRTIFQQADRTWLRAGAGIVLGSTPDREFEETCEKLQSLVPHVRHVR